MVDYNYKENTNSKIAKRRAIRSVVIAATATILGVASYVVYDALSESTVINNTQPSTSTLGEQAEQSVFDEETFRLVTDSSWQEAPSLEENLKSFRYQRYDRGIIKSELTVYVDDMPREYALTHVLPVEAEGNSVISHAVSPHCNQLQPDKSNKRDVQISWFGVSFLCDPDLNAYVVGSSHPETGHALRLEGEYKSHDFFFVYRDLQAAGQLDDFVRVLENFEAK